MIPAARLDSVEVLRDDLFPLVRVQVIQVDLTVYGSVGAVNETSSVTRPPIDAQIVLVWHHDMI